MTASAAFDKTLGQLTAAQCPAHTKRPRRAVICRTVKPLQTIPWAEGPGRVWEMWSDCCRREFVWHPISSSLSSNLGKTCRTCRLFYAYMENILYHCPHPQNVHLQACLWEHNCCYVVVKGRERESPPSPRHSSEGGNILSHNCRRTENWRKKEKREREKQTDGWVVAGNVSWTAVHGNEGIETEWPREKSKEI